MQKSSEKMHYVQHEISATDIKMVIAQTNIPILQAGQVLVKVHSFGINRADTLQRQGKYPPPPGESDILGLEMAGHVVETSSNVTDYRIGQQVFGLVAGGGYAEYVAVDVRHIMPIPAQCDCIQAAGIAEVFLTAYQSLFSIGQFKPKQSVLIHAGASGVGLAAIQLAKLAQCTIATTISNQQKAAACLEVGATYCILYPQEDFVESLKSKHFAADIIIDFVGGDYLNRNLKVLSLDGKIIQLAMLNGRFSDPVDIATLLRIRATIQGSTLRNRSDEYKAELIGSFSQNCLPKFDSGQLKANIHKTFCVQQINEAHKLLEQNETIGKLICSW